MSVDLLLSLFGFCLVALATPGPNNLMLMASGANFGLLRTVPHGLGVALGHSFMVVLLGLGLVRLFESYPEVRLVLTGVCSLYLLYLAWKIATAAPPKEAEAAGRPLTFLQAAAFQWVNPKAVYIGITAQTYYAPPDAGWIGAVLVALPFLCVSLGTSTLWTALGTQVRRLLSTRGRLRAFNWTMAALLVGTLVPILAGLEI